MRIIIYNETSTITTLNTIETREEGEIYPAEITSIPMVERTL